MAGVIFLSLSQSILSWCALDCLSPHSAFVNSDHTAQWTQEPTYTTYFCSQDVIITVQFKASEVTKQSSKPSYQTSLCTFRIPISFTSRICTQK